MMLIIKRNLFLMFNAPQTRLFIALNNINLIVSGQGIFVSLFVYIPFDLSYFYEVFENM